MSPRPPKPDYRRRAGGAPRPAGSAGSAGSAGPKARPRPVDDPLVGTEVEVEVGPVAHGGHCVARHEGRVIFVRHALPGERVRVLVTEGRVKDSYLRGDAVAVLEAVPERVTPPCPYAGPGRCGGCDFQHVALSHQRVLKRAVVREQFRRLAGLEVDVEVEPVPGDEEGLRWRSRVEFAVDAQGRAGLRAHRSHDVIPLDDCLIAGHRVIESGVLGTTWTGCRGVDVVAADIPDDAVLIPLPEGRVPRVGQRVVTPMWSGEFELQARGFWQVHPGAAPTFVTHVLAELDPRPGERALDLYAGVGLFALALADAVGEDGAVLAVEGDERAVDDGIANASGHPQVEFRAGSVDDVLAVLREQGIGTDLVVLDPPRTGAGRAVIEDLVTLGARAIAYVACDPAALARDTAYLLAGGYRLRSLRAFDAFP
ncbi:MAG: TRAM domain-containing protein, partial [Lapillicoccus sp.]